MVIQRSTGVSEKCDTAIARPYAIAQRKCSCGQHTINGECTECRKKRDQLQRKVSSDNSIDGSTTAVTEVLQSPGQPIESNTRPMMEDYFGRDFSQVRVHTGSLASESAQSINATAYAIGRQIVFSKGAYNPNTTRGLGLLAHELTHVVQQGNSSPSRQQLEVGPDDSGAEKEAENVEKDFIAKPQLTNAEKQPNRSGDNFPFRMTSRQGNRSLVQRQPLLNPGPSSTQSRLPPSLQVIEGGASRQIAKTETRLIAREATRATGRQILQQGFRKLFWKKFWLAVVQRFGIRGTVAAALSAADGPLPIGEIISLGLAIWTAYEIIQIWDELTAEAERAAEAEMTQDSALTESQPETAREQDEDPQRRCQAQTHLPTCVDWRSIEDVAGEFAAHHLEMTIYDLDCREFGGYHNFDDCLGSPGVNWHCSVPGTEFVVSLSGCLCCNEDGSTGHDWHPHQSPGLQN